jgi:hypothetical protein
MADIYGHKWTSNYGDCDTDGTWAKGLADMTNDDLKRGFFACLNSGEAWPPSLPEFRAMCKGPKRENEMMYAIPRVPQLPHKIDDEARAIARQAIAAMRSAIK